MMKRFIQITFAAGLIGCGNISFAANLMQVYDDAVAHDPVYKKAIAARLSAREAKPQSIAGLLPTVGGSASDTNYKNRYAQPLPGTGNNSLNYGLQAYSLTVTQPIFNFASWMTVRQASALVKKADAEYGAAMQDLVVRIAAAYFNVLQAEDTLRITQAQKKLLERQLHEAEQRHEVGVGTMTNVYNARANYDLTVAQEIADKNTVNNNYETLRALTGKRYESLAKLNKQIPLISPVPADIERWVVAARQQNLNLRAVRFAADAARENIKIKAGGHVPTLNAAGGYTSNKGSVVDGTLGSNPGVVPKESSSVGLTLNVPVFQGGLVNSQVRQAQYDYQQATADMEYTHENTVTAMRQTYTSVLADIAKIKADQESIKSNRSAYESNEAAYRAGVATNVDLLSAQRALFNAERQYAADQYIYVNDTLKLKQLAGTLSEKDLQIINSWLREQPASVIPAQAARQSKKVKRN